MSGRIWPTRGGKKATILNLKAGTQPKRGYMLKTLIDGNRKQPDMKWDISTPELREAAFLELFKLLKATWKVYQCGYWGKTKAEKAKQHKLYGLANAGDGKAAEKLLTMRINYEYENWHIASVPKNGGEPKLVLSRRQKSPYVKALRLGASLPSVQRRALETAATLIEQHGDGMVEELKTTPVRPTDLQKAQDAISSLTLLLESSQRLLKDLIQYKYTPASVESDYLSIGRDFDSIKERMKDKTP